MISAIIYGPRKRFSSLSPLRVCRRRLYLSTRSPTEKVGAECFKSYRFFCFPCSFVMFSCAHALMFSCTKAEDQFHQELMNLLGGFVRYRRNFAPSVSDSKTKIWKRLTLHLKKARFHPGRPRADACCTSRNLKRAKNTKEILVNSKVSARQPW